MRRILPAFIFFFPLVLLATSVFGADLSVHMEISTPSVKVGGVPVFFVAVKNISKEPVKILNLVKRRDLKDVYARFSVTASGAAVAVPIAISDPGPIGDSDWVVLAPGKTFKFEHNGFPLGLEHLTSGAYEASMQFTYNITSEPIRSNAVAFRVVP